MHKSIRGGATMTVTTKQHAFGAEKKAPEGVFEKHWGSSKRIEVYRELDENLGISIVCGKVDLHTSDSTVVGSTSGIFIKSVVPNSAAGKSEQFHTGDRILEVGGVDLTEANHEEAVTAIRTAHNPVSFIVQSLIPLNKICEHPDEAAPEANHIADDQDEHDFAPAKQSDLIPARAESASPDERMEEEDDEDSEPEVLEHKPLIKSHKGHEIDRTSAGNFSRSAEEIAADEEEEDEFGYTNDKIKKKYASLGSTIMMVQLERGQQGLGLSLAGHKDRNCMAVFVCGLNPNGAAYRMGGIQVGDEILEVNGVVLHGRCHLNASAIIKGLAGPIFKIIILRRKAAINDIAVRPVTQFPVSLEEEVSEEKFSNFPNVRSIAVKKGNHSLGIMIIEGKHAELGQGIFISDIQEGSAADKAGLEVGEMVLAVNKDCLLGADYDTAANLLKRTEGLVTLILSSPARKSTPTVPEVAVAEESKEPKESKTAPELIKPAVPPPRTPTPVPDVSADPATCKIIPGKNTTIEVVTDNQALGLFFVGGTDTPFAGAVVVVEVYPGCSADKDGRIQPGDQILEANGVCLKEATYEIVLQTLRQTLPKMKLIILRPEKVEFTTVEVELTKKPGKGLGLSVIGKKSNKGVYVTEILNGGSAEIDGRILKGDMLLSVNGQSAESLSTEEAGALLKTAAGKVSLKFCRYKPIIR